MNVFLDTNIWLRYFIGDDKKQLETVRTIITANDAGRIKISTSTFALSEFIYVESSYYKIDKKNILEDLESIRLLRNLWLIEETKFADAIILYKSSNSKNIKWSDCIITTQVPLTYTFCSFDEKLEKLIGKDRFIHPKQLVKFLETPRKVTSS